MVGYARIRWGPPGRYGSLGAVTGSLHALALGWGQYSAELEKTTRVLVVDDDEAARDLFVVVLEEADIECESADSGEAALQMFLAANVDVVLVDKNLPGMDGLEFVKRCQGLDRDCEAVLITGYANLDSVLQAIDLRAGYLLRDKSACDLRQLPHGCWEIALVGDPYESIS